MPSYKIYCIIPAYNEERTIGGVINGVKKYVNKAIVVDDGSRDRTYELAKAQNATVLRHIINRGQGAALQTGMEYALKNGADIIVHFDADGQFVANEIKDLIKPIITGEAHIVFGSRFLEKKSDIPWLKKNIIIPLAKIINKIFLDVNLTDPQSGFRALTKEAAKKIEIQQDEMAHCSEILYKAREFNLKIKEVPITVVYHNFGQKFSGGVKILKELFVGALLK